MPRNAWAKVYCDLLRHPKIVGRPDCDVRLFLGLILYAKEYAPETGLVPLSAPAMRDMFGIKAPVRMVETGLAYFVAAGVLLKEGEHVRIRDFAARQSADSAAERQARWRDNSRDERVTKRNANVSSNVYIASPEVEGEKEKEEVSAQSHEGNSQPYPQEAVDNPNLEGLSDSDKARIQKLFFLGKATEATALLASLKRSESLEKTRPGEATG